MPYVVAAICGCGSACVMDEIAFAGVDAAAPRCGRHTKLEDGAQRIR